MKKFFIAFAMFCFSVFCSNIVFADESVVSVSISDKKEISPNAVQISFAIETSNNNVDTAIRENKNKADLLYSSLKSLIDTKRGDYLKTARYTVRPDYDYNKGKKTLKGYTVTNSVIVFSKDTNLVSKFIDTASNKGITSIENLSFSSASYENECNVLLEGLSKKAILRANSALKPLNSKVSSVKNMSMSCSESSSPRSAYYAKSLMTASANDAAEQSTPVEVGKIFINANVNVSFYVEKQKQ